MDKKHFVTLNKNLLIGGITGGIIGAAAALLLAPKSGSDLINGIAHPLTKAKTRVKKAAMPKKKKNPVAQKKRAKKETASDKKETHSHKETHAH